VVIEVCPTSNWYTGAIPEISAHPAPVFRDAGIRVVLGDDNPMQTGSALADERQVLAGQLGWTDTALAALDRDSVAAAFLHPAQREVLLARL
jgi:adenosine deaminase